jgi:hypothetical protein
MQRATAAPVEDRVWRAAQLVRERDAWELGDAYVERDWNQGDVDVVAAVTFSFQERKAVVFSLRFSGDATNRAIERVHAVLGRRYKRQDPRDEAPNLVFALCPPTSARGVLDELDAIAHAVDGRGGEVTTTSKQRASLLWSVLDALHASAIWRVRSFGFHNATRAPSRISTTFSLMADAGHGAPGMSSLVFAKRAKTAAWTKLAEDMRATLVAEGFADRTSDADPVVWLQHAVADVSEAAVLVEAKLLESVQV